MARVHTSRKSIKKAYKWCGTGQTRTVETAVSTSTAEVLILCPVVSIAAYNDVVVERTILNFAIRRELTSDVLALAAMVCVQPIVTGGILPVQVLDALSTDDADYGAKNILHWESLPIPALLEAFDGGGKISGEVAHVQWDIPVKRRLNRERELLTLNINSDVTAVIKVFMQSRVLLSYGRR